MTTLTSVLDALADAARPALTAVVPGVELRQQRPEDAESLVCLYLLRLSPASATHNLPQHRPGLGNQPLPAAGITADVLFSFHGSQALLLAESVLSTFHRQALVQPDDQPDGQPGEQLIPVRLQPTTVADLSAIWTMLSQPHSPSLVYQVGPFDLATTSGDIG